MGTYRPPAPHPTFPGISAERLSRHVYKLAETIGERNVLRPRALQRAEDYVGQSWEALGYTVSPQAYTVQGVPCANLAVERRGAGAPSDVVVLGAHYDSVAGSPGANDNGSGVAALLELSRVFAGVQPYHTIRFVAFTNEEPPFFFTRRQGSDVYARAARRRGDRIQFMIALETIGCFRSESGTQSYPALLRHFFPPCGNFIACISNFRSLRMMRRFVTAFRAGSDFPIQYAALPALVPGVAWSDHLSFWRQGYRAMMLTDTAFYRYPYYHSAADTAEKLNYAEFARMTNGLVTALVLFDAQDL
ncbi:MAG: aminopeptidase [Gammaproteobacteria bacterium SG8_47]|nr:MAG: aminopeptidase [Gammaproteobacteria bacterium SG8_47]